MEVVSFNSWGDFRNDLSAYFEQPAERRQQLVFRGQRDSGWMLQTTLDRGQTFRDDHHRQEHINVLLREFKQELIQLVDRTPDLEGVAFELLARHHGLPSPLLDWTQSPYIAAYFCYASVQFGAEGTAALWVLDRAKLPSDADWIALIDDSELLRWNVRAVRQRGVFLRLGTSGPLEKLLDTALTKLELPWSDAPRALSELDEMTINATYLFSDMESAARTAALRVATRRSEPWQP